MKILQVNEHYTDRGGVEQYLLAAGKLLDASGHTNAILYRHQTPDTIRDSSWPSYCLGESLDRDSIGMLQRVIEIEQPDVAFIHHVSSSILVEEILRLVPSVAYVHGPYVVCPGLAKYYRRNDRVCERPFGWGCFPMHYLRRCSSAHHPRTVARLMETTSQFKRVYLRLPRLVVATDYMKALLLQNGFDAGRIRVLAPHFLDLSEIPEYVPPTKPCTLLYAGRLEIEKGLPYLLHALFHLPEDFRLIIAGDGSMRATYEHLITSLQLVDRVELTGWLSASDMRDQYQQSALVVIPSIGPEAFGKTGVEALTYGRPVVAFNVGGVSEWLLDGVTGFLAQPVDSKDLAQKIRRLIEDRPLQEAMGRRGQHLVAERYATDQHAMHLEAILREARGADS